MRQHIVTYMTFALLLLCCTTAVGQQSSIDSLEMLLPSVKDDSVKAAILVQLCWAYRNIKVEKAELYGEQAVELCQEKQFTYLLSKVLNHIGFININKNYHASALIYYFKSVEIAEKYGHQDQLGYAYHSIAESYRVKKEYRKARDYASQGLAALRKAKDTNGEGYIYLTFGRIFKEQDQYTEAIASLEKARTVWEVLKNENGVANVLLEYAAVAIKQKEFQKVDNYLRKASSIFDKLNNIRGDILVSNLYVDMLVGENQTDSALVYARRSLALSEKASMTELIVVAYDKLAKIYAARKQYEKSYQYAQLFIHYADSLREVEKDRDVMEIEAKYATNKKDQAIESLEQQNRNKENTLYLLITLLGAVGTIGVLLYLNVKQKQATNRQLIFQQEQIKAQNSRLSLLNAEVNLQKEKQEKLNTFKDKLFSIISHDLRNPIASLKGALDLLKMDYLTEEERSMLVEKLSQDLQSSSYLLDNLLNWAKSQMQGLKVMPVYLTLQELIAENFDLLSSQALEKQITLEANIAKDLKVYADLEITKTIIRNLLHNAIKYSFQAGKVSVSAYPKDELVVIAVRDQGRGMSAEEQKKLFGSEHFSKYGTANEKGSGLGLLLSKDFVEKNGGSIWVESTENKGSTFCFTLPIKPINKQ